jgi:hypothetical protein
MIYRLTNNAQGSWTWMQLQAHKDAGRGQDAHVQYHVLKHRILATAYAHIQDGIVAYLGVTFMLPVYAARDLRQCGQQSG